MRCSDVINAVNSFAPEEFACKWDNVGLNLGRRERSVGKILLALEITDRVADYAIAHQVDMIITHHPFIFRPIRNITSDNAQGRVIMKLLHNDISCYSVHTNYDMIPGGMAELFAERLGYSPEEPIADVVEVTMPNGKNRRIGSGRMMTDYEGIHLTDLCATLKAKFGIKHLEVYKPDGGAEDDPVFHRIAVCPGSGKSMIGECMDLGAEVFITADVTYHEAMDAVANGLTIVNAGHYGMEAIFVSDFEKHLSKFLSSEVEVLAMPDSVPYLSL